jgi:hypothetical protein
VKLAVGTRDNGIDNLDNKLALMAMLHALPCEGYGDFTSSLIRQKDLTRSDVEAVFQVEQTKRNAHCGPLLSPSGDAALRAAAQPPRQNKPGVKCGFCTGEGHNEDACYKKDRARKDTQKAVEERRANRDSGKKGRANRAATPSSLLPALSDGAKVTELAASASVRLAGSPDTHADAHWIADTGATSHMSPRRSWFTKLEPLAIPIRVANNHVVYSEGVGSVVLEPANKSLRPVLLCRVLYVPALQNNLLSVLHLVANHRFCIEIEGKEMVFLQSGERRFTAAIRDNTAWLNASTPPAPEAALRGEAVMNRALWHCRLCHIGADRLEQAIKGKVATRLVVESNTPVLTHCEPGIRGKHHRDLFPQRASHRATSFLKRIHSDLHQLPVLTSTGFCYWLLFINDYSRYFWIYLLPKKSETFHAFTQFKAMVERSCACTTTRVVSSSASSGTRSSRNTASGASIRSRCRLSRTASLSASTALSKSCSLPCSTARACPHGSGAKGSTTCATSLCAACRARSLRAQHPTRWCTSISPSMRPCSLSQTVCGTLQQSSSNTQQRGGGGGSA